MRKKVERSNPLGAHGHVITRDGVTVAVRAYEITQASRTKYEILLEGNGLTAIVDVCADESDLDTHVQEATSAFIACARLRLSQRT
jgi:hypothetical protein